MRKLVVILLFHGIIGTAFGDNHLPPKINYQTGISNFTDWMQNPNQYVADIHLSSDQKNIILDNGLVRRSFRLLPNLVCTDLLNLSNGEQLLRAISPEARLTLNSTEYNVGGLSGQEEKAYLRYEWLNDMSPKFSDFQYQTYHIDNIKPNLQWNYSGKFWAPSLKQPTGKMITFNFESRLPELKGIRIKVNYELYDGIPLISKWICVQNLSERPILLNRITSEIIAAPEEESSVEGPPDKFKIPHGLYIESNYAFNNSMNGRLSDQTSNWLRDTTYKSQVNYLYNTPCVLQVYPPVGPGITLLSGQTFRSIKTNQLLLDGYDRERNGLAQRQMYRKIAPWAMQNPIFMHLTSTDSAKFKLAVDQCAETGYEAIILSFGSGVHMEDQSVENINKIKRLVTYAHRKGILLGCYSLFSSRKINAEEDVIDPKTGKPDVHALFGGAPCLGSKWGLSYLAKIKRFIKDTGLDLLEHDGPYPGDVCASTKHPGHKGLEDSQWAQMELQKGLYRWCAENGVYVNAPDWYFLDGTNKIALGYREVNFSLPRENQILLNRQNIYDGTWEKTPSMSWGFVPLTEYHGGGAAATLEPLSQHLDAYEQLMMQYYGAGIQACYRGPRLYDSEETKHLVIKVISWYKKYRSILNADIIHLRRPDGRDWDGIMHVDPQGKEKGLAMIYNPTGEVITRTVKLPLYYTGLRKKIRIRVQEGKPKTFQLTSDASISYQVTIPANGYNWLVID